MTSTVALIVAKDELPPGRIWGTGAWLPPEGREGLDWLTLTRLLGWDVLVVTLTPEGQLAEPLPASATTIIVAGDPDALAPDSVAAIEARLEGEPVLVVSRAAGARRPMAVLAGVARTDGTVSGRSIRWLRPGPEESWPSAQEITARGLVVDDDTEVWASLEASPIVAARRRGRGIVATLAVHPSALRDADHSGTAVLKRLLTWGAPRGTAWLDFERTLVLRMDDPGGAQNVYSRTWSYQKLGRDAWGAIGRVLDARDARISLAYVGGWVDDGDEARGLLTVDGQMVPRIAGYVYPTPAVRYEDFSGHAPGAVHDYREEFEGIQALRRAGLADVELHGYTHMHPDRAAWARASDRFESWPQTAWFRELGTPASAALAALPAVEHPLSRGIACFDEYFDTMPTTLICPGDQWTDPVLERALDLGFQLVDSYYLAIRDAGRFCWAQHVCAPYLNLPAASWFVSELPVVGYFHDREPAVEGVWWLADWLDRWQEAGARRFIDFRELASALDCRVTLQESEGACTLVVDRRGGAAPVRPIPVRIRTRGARPLALTVQFTEGAAVVVTVQPHEDGGGLVLVPAADRTREG